MKTKNDNRTSMGFPLTRLLLFTLLFSFVAFSCDDDDDDIILEDDNLVDVAISQPELSTFVDAVQHANLADFFSNLNASYTIFAPDNDAFAAFLAANNFSAVEQIPSDALAAVLRYHVVQGEQLSGSLQSGNLTTLAGEDISVDVSSGVTINGSANVVTADLTASNGVIHVIDRVLLPPNSIATLAIADPELSTLVAILSLPEFSDLLDAVSDANSDLTVFAPTNAAFDATLTALGKTDINELPQDVLREILEYHILGESLTASELMAGPYTTLQGEDITVTTDGGVAINGEAVVAADIVADNGVIHKIGGVLLPAEPTAVLGTTLGIAYFNPDFTTLVAAVKKADLVETLLGLDPNTIFAPTNAAFEAAGITNLDDFTAEDLTPILTYHVLAEEVTAENLQASHVTVQGEELYPRVAGETAYINGNAEVIAADLTADNGVVHAIDMVLMPPMESIAGIVTNMAGDEDNPEFTLLLAAVVKAGLAETLTSGGPFTVFAPTDAAFEALFAADNGISSLDDLTAAQVENILLYHVVPGVIFSVELSSGAVTTAQGQDITIDVENLTITDANDGTANLNAELLNVLATNGVIHVIDQVLVPAE